jgi:hypothetical protein
MMSNLCKQGGSPALDFGLKARFSGARRNTSPSMVLGSMMSLKLDSLQKEKMGVGGSISSLRGANGSSPAQQMRESILSSMVRVSHALNACVCSKFTTQRTDKFPWI